MTVELNVIVREYDPITEKWRVLFDETHPIEPMQRNHALRWMLTKVAEIYPDERRSLNPSDLG